MTKQIESDVVIIGAGITGTTIARELARYKVETIVVEKCGDAGNQGQSKSAAGMIYTGLVLLMSFILKSVMAPNAPLYDPNSQRIKWLEQGFDMAAQWLEELDIKYRKPVTLVVALNKEEVKILESLVRFGESIGGRYTSPRWADRKICLSIEPCLTKDIVAGLYSEGDLIHTSPWEIAIAQSDNAKQNSVKFMMHTEVIGVIQKNGYQIVETNRGPIKTRFIVNAAGLEADRVADMGGGARDWGLNFLRTLHPILDKRVGHLVNTCLNGVPVPGKGPVAYRTLDGNLKIETGTYQQPRDRYDLGAYPGEALQNIARAKKYIPEISEKDIIRAYVGMRPFNTRDPEENIIEPCSSNPKFINAIVRLPGITPALPIAKYVVELLGNAGLELTTKSDFNPYRKDIPHFRNLSSSEQDKLIARDPRYGHIVCRCESITEGEIVEAIKRGARTVAAVRYRVRAGMGRCQGGFCGPRVVQIIARELNIPITEVMESEIGSAVVPYKNKELLREAVRIGG